jgi:putative SOS response-associated peptidase YedK
MALAGLWDHWLGADGSEIETMAILTVPANPEVRRVHERMPVILPPDRFDDWLDTTSGRSVEALAMLRPAPVGFLEVAQVTTRIDNPRADEPGVQEIIGRMVP